MNARQKGNLEAIKKFFNTDFESTKRDFFGDIKPSKKFEEIRKKIVDKCEAIEKKGSMTNSDREEIESLTKSALSLTPQMVSYERGEKDLGKVQRRALSNLTKQIGVFSQKTFQYNATSGNKHAPKLAKQDKNLFSELDLYMSIANKTVANKPLDEKEKAQIAKDFGAGKETLSLKEAYTKLESTFAQVKELPYVEHTGLSKHIKGNSDVAKKGLRNGIIYAATTALATAGFLGLRFGLNAGANPGYGASAAATANFAWGGGMIAFVSVVAATGLAIASGPVARFFLEKKATREFLKKESIEQQRFLVDIAKYCKDNKNSKSKSKGKKEFISLLKGNTEDVYKLIYGKNSKIPLDENNKPLVSLGYTDKQISNLSLLYNKFCNYNGKNEPYMSFSERRLQGKREKDADSFKRNLGMQNQDVYGYLNGLDNSWLKSMITEALKLDNSPKNKGTNEQVLPKPSPQVLLAADRQGQEEVHQGTNSESQPTEENKNNAEMDRLKKILAKEDLKVQGQKFTFEMKGAEFTTILNKLAYSLNNEQLDKAMKDLPEMLELLQKDANLEMNVDKKGNTTFTITPSSKNH